MSYNTNNVLGKKTRSLIGYHIFITASATTLTPSQTSMLLGRIWLKIKQVVVYCML